MTNMVILPVHNEYASKKYVDNGFEKVFKQLDLVETNVTKKIYDGFAKVDARFEKVDERLVRIDERLDKIDARLDKLETQIDSVATQVTLLTKVNKIADRV